MRCIFKPKGVKCYVVEPSGTAVLSGKEVTRSSHRLQGGGYAMKILPAISSISEGEGESSSIDDYLEVTDEQAIQTARDLAKFEGIYGGFSARANVAHPAFKSYWRISHVKKNVSSYSYH
jgi:cysteine synthase A